MVGEGGCRVFSSAGSSSRVDGDFGEVPDWVGNMQDHQQKLFTYITGKMQEPATAQLTENGGVCTALQRGEVARGVVGDVTHVVDLLSTL